MEGMQEYKPHLFMTCVECNVSLMGTIKIVLMETEMRIIYCTRLCKYASFDGYKKEKVYCTHHYRVLILSNPRETKSEIIYRITGKRYLGSREDKS